MMLILTGCNLDLAPELPTPTVEPVLTPSLTPTEAPTATPSLAPTASPTSASPTPAEIRIETDTPTPTLSPTITLTPTSTPGPYVHTINEGETLYGIILQYYPIWTVNLADEVVALNANVPNRDSIPGPGNEILIPRPTATPIPAGLELTRTLVAEIGGGEILGDTVLPYGAQSGCHEVSEGETLVGIMDIYNTTLEILSQLNPDLNWFGCNFTNPSGGPGCNPGIRVDQCINVPLPTPVPTSSPTPSGDETATPTPTYAPPRLVYPPEGAVAPPGQIRLEWVSAGLLEAGEVYLVELIDTLSERNWRQITRQTAVTLPVELIPTSGQTHPIQWRVSIAREAEGGRYQYVGVPGNWRTLQWQSR